MVIRKFLIFYFYWTVLLSIKGLKIDFFIVKETSHILANHQIVFSCPFPAPLCRKVQGFCAPSQRTGDGSLLIMSWLQKGKIVHLWRRKWQPTPVFLPGESQGRGSLVGCRPWGCTESDTTEAT